MDHATKILIVGQTPPPLGGQAVMVQKIVESDLKGIQLHFVPMQFSSDMDDIGRFRYKKLFRLPSLIIRIWISRLLTGARTLYYAPGGETITAVARDIAVLLSCRLLFARVIFHIHAGGFTDVAEATPLPFRVLARLAYRKPDLAIQLTENSPPDGARIAAKRIVHIPNGIPDDAGRYLAHFRDPSASQRIELLFVGMVSESKGVRVLLEACALLKHRGFDFRLRVAGRFHSPDFEEECASFISVNDLGASVEFLGVVTGDEKWQMFCSADIFCFPSHFKSENQSLVILEAMQFGLPSVASDWRSMATMIQDGETGYIVPVGNSNALADRVAWLIENPDLRAKMGQKAREVFLSAYTDDVWRANIESAIRG